VIGIKEARIMMIKDTHRGPDSKSEHGKNMNFSLCAIYTSHDVRRAIV
jgi:hypothetical protein